MAYYRLAGLLLAASMLSACVAPLPPPEQVLAPPPILNNSGEFMSPYTQDGVLAPWVDKAINVKLATTVGATAGSLIAQHAMGQIPFVGGILGGMAGDAVARSIAIQAIGGEDYLKSTSDISFHNLNDMSVYIYAKNSHHPAYADALSATMEIYPDLKNIYNGAVASAPRIEMASQPVPPANPGEMASARQK